MDAVLLGILPENAPLHDFLARLLKLENPVFESYRLHPKMLLVAYRDRISLRSVACKFFGRKLPSEGEKPDADHFRRVMQREESAIEEISRLGFDLPPYRVVRVLGRNEELEFLLVEEYVDGPQLDHFLRRAYKQMLDRVPLQHCLRQLGSFLSQLHERSAKGRVDPKSFEAPLHKYLDHLQQRDIQVSTELVQELRQAASQQRDFGEVTASLVHGDCTPVNFIFPAENEVVAIDLERSHRSDPLRDLGALEAELRLAAITLAKDARACLPEITALRAAYGPHHGGRRDFWAGTALVRISRNDWHTDRQRRQILEEALKCLSR
jgi:aminoglycoside phosphotransferase (APT) family kinase protein